MAKTRHFKAFVISPIGKEGSPERAHADWVFEEIIAKACERLRPQYDIHVVRADHEERTGSVMGRVLQNILHHDLVIAVLAFERPNVYYELALAHAAARNVIMLRSENPREPRHFDVTDMNVESYDYQAGRAAPEKLIARLVKYIENTLDEPIHREKAFDKYDPFGRVFREYRFYDEFRHLAVKEVNVEEMQQKNIVHYSDYFLNANEFLTLTGITLKHFTHPRFTYTRPDGDLMTFSDVLQYLITVKGVDVRAVMLHPSNPTLPAMLSYDGPDKFKASVQQVKDECREAFKAWKRIAKVLERQPTSDKAPKRGSLEIIQLRHSPMRYRMTLTDGSLLLTPYFNQIPYNGQSPSLAVTSTAAFYRAIKEDLDVLIRDDRRAPPGDVAATGGGT
ncbi:hypothetical protein ACTZWW_10025 [Salinarimonas sp. NSM]|uniref:hypothetical protein n=1 Tax=Salinarimonas sp. NSM TaxID=3458003 RepID=UPI004035C7A4